MTKKLIHFFWTILPFAIITLTFQNCSVYESDGRKSFNETGLALLIGTSSSSLENNSKIGELGKIQSSNCSPYLNGLQSIISASSPQSLHFNEELNQLACVISSKQICTIQENSLDLLEIIENTNVITDSHPKNQLTNGSFAYTSKENNQLMLHFLGATNTNKLIHCRYSFNEQNPLEEEFQNRLIEQRDLVHLINQNL